MSIEIRDELFDSVELINLYHLAQTPVGYKRYDRMIWASNEYAKIHEVSPLKTYQALEQALA